MIEVQIKTAYQRPLKLAQIKAFCDLTAREKLEYLEKTHLSDLVITNHLICCHLESNLDDTGERPKCWPLSQQGYWPLLCLCKQNHAYYNILLYVKCRYLGGAFVKICKTNIIRNVCCLGMTLKTLALEW